MTYCTLYIFFQETEVQGVNKDVLLLLVLYREITLTNASSVQNPKLAEVSRVSMDVIENNSFSS